MISMVIPRHPITSYGQRNWNLYLKPLLLELSVLQHDFPVLRASAGPAPLITDVRVILLFATADARALSTLCNRCECGSHNGACHWCTQTGIRAGTTTVYPGHFR